MSDEFLERTSAAVSAEGALWSLLRANRAIAGELSLPVVLRTIVEVACDLVSAPYGALGVLAPDGDGLQEFIYVGIDEATAQAIGELPQGKGLLGALIDDPHSIRLAELGADPRSIGFPPNHPPMRAFLGVPLRVHDEVFGNLYLAAPGRKQFDARDEELVEALAASAAVAIINARRFEEATRRHRWLQASTEVTRELLIGTKTALFQMVAERVLTLADADTVTVVTAVNDRTLEVAVAVGEGADALPGIVYDRHNTFVDDVMRAGDPVVVTDLTHVGAASGQYLHLSGAIAVGPVMAFPVVGPESVGVLTVARKRGRAAFGPADVEMASTFASQAALALELAQARQTQQLLGLVEDRSRIARDLHDHVIQQLFGAGLALQGILPRVPEAAADRIGEVVDRIDDAILQIRTSIFGLQVTTASDGQLRAAVVEAVDEASRALGFTPRLTFEGPVDTATDVDLTNDVVAVVREALSNAARHAHATDVIVSVRVGQGEMSIVVIDNGVGLGEELDHSSGLANLDSRAQARAGSFEATGREPSGTRLYWRVPLQTRS